MGKQRDVKLSARRVTRPQQGLCLSGCDAHAQAAARRLGIEMLTIFFVLRMSQESQGGLCTKLHGHASLCTGDSCTSLQITDEFGGIQVARAALAAVSAIALPVA